MQTADGLMCDVCKEVYAASDTVRFRHRGRAYEVDLCADHVRKLDKVLDEFVSGARVVE